MSLSSDTKITIKCRKCRKDLLKTTMKCILNAHGEIEPSETEPKDALQQPEISSCQSIQEKNKIFVSEDEMASWMNLTVSELEFTKGKLNCPHCDYRVGSFDFISGLRCQCLNLVLPPVNLVRSKVDYPIFLEKE